VSSYQQRRIEQRHRTFTDAVAHRTTIGIALGILMESDGVDRGTAFARLRLASFLRDRSLHQTASELVVNRDLPEDLT
jgi:AmiR/NasT family two-component response regulator